MQNFNEIATAQRLPSSLVMDNPGILLALFKHMLKEDFDTAYVKDVQALLDWEKCVDSALLSMTPSQLLKLYQYYKDDYSEEAIVIKNEIASCAKKNPQVEKHMKFFTIMSGANADARVLHLTGTYGRYPVNVAEALSAAIEEGDIPLMAPPGRQP